MFVLYACQQLIASYIWKVAWKNWLQSRLKAIYGGVGGDYCHRRGRSMLPCGNFVTNCVASFDV